jgi:hypothetical protein
VTSLHAHVQGVKKVGFFKKLKLKYFFRSKFGKNFAPKKKKEKKRNRGSNRVKT